MKKIAILIAVVALMTVVAARKAMAEGIVLMPWWMTVTIFQDEDGDGIKDSDDNCPSVSNDDQADADGDGFGDACDGCPDDDTYQFFEDSLLCDDDDDGVVNDNDECSDTAGPEENAGCPDDDAVSYTVADDDDEDEAEDLTDSDGDGIPDLDDACEDEAGVESNFGCPAEGYDVFTLGGDDTTDLDLDSDATVQASSEAAGGCSFMHDVAVNPVALAMIALVMLPLAYRRKEK